MVAVKACIWSFQYAINWTRPNSKTFTIGKVEWGLRGTQSISKCMLPYWKEKTRNPNTSSPILSFLQENWVQLILLTKRGCTDGRSRFPTPVRGWTRLLSGTRPACSASEPLNYMNSTQIRWSPFPCKDRRKLRTETVQWLPKGCKVTIVGLESQPRKSRPKVCTQKLCLLRKGAFYGLDLQ